MAQKVLITAAASGIGLEIARAFAEAGSTVFITDIHQQTIDAATIEIPGLLATLCNNGKRSDIERMVPEAVAALGGLDVLVNNAGIAGPTAPVEEMDPDKWEEVMAVDLVGTFNVTRLAIPYLKKSSAGSIITMSSLGGRFGYPNRSPYNVAKAGLIGFAKTLAIELGDHNISFKRYCSGSRRGPADRKCAGRPRQSSRQERGRRTSIHAQYSNDQTVRRSERYRISLRFPCLRCRQVHLGAGHPYRQWRA
jgi:NAD(P)-dependent dehydrogenase (short-subunit alcohol dehydrogenase family)